MLVDADLTGVLLGCTLNTKPEEIYRALIEATAYGTNMIIETFESYGVPINELYACGGIAEKDEFMMQIYADVTNRRSGYLHRRRPWRWVPPCSAQWPQERQGRLRFHI